MNALVTRARGLGSRLVGEAVLAEIERARDQAGLALALGRAGLGEDASVDAVEALARNRIIEDLKILSRWARDHRDAMTVIELDEDRRSLRTLVRGLAAGVGSVRRRAACIPTSRLTARILIALSEVTSLADLAQILTMHEHPLAPALASHHATIDVLAIEAALTERFAALAREHVDDRALRVYLAQLIDGENTESAILLAARGKRIDATQMFIGAAKGAKRPNSGAIGATRANAPMRANDARVRGGTRHAASTRPADVSHLTLAEFERAAAGPLDETREILATALRGTPLERAVRTSSPAAVEDATLAWQLASQRAMRRASPHGLSSVLFLVLRRREEARRLRRAAWRFALGGAR